MRLRIERVALVGTSREITLQGGLNLIVGPTTTGKTSLMRLLRVLLGSDYDGIIPELRSVPDVSGKLLIGDEAVAVVRRLSQSENAPVDIATEGFAARLPAMHADRERQVTYGNWLVEQLDLPRLRVPTAPSRPEDAATTPVSVADYLRYCRLTQQQIDTDVLGSSNFFSDYKRRVVFRIYFGSFDAQIAELQEELRGVEGELRALRAGTGAFDRFLEGTVLANRAQLEADLATARGALEAVIGRRGQLPGEAPHQSQGVELRTGLREIDLKLADLDARHEAEIRSGQQMNELARQLRAQSARLTKAVVAGAALVDFDFRVCPRCGEALESERSDEAHCYLCLQQPPQRLSREDLLAEQTRVEQQIDEADELRVVHESAALEIAESRESRAAQRRQLSARLDELTATFVSDEAEQIAMLAAAQASAEAQVQQGEEYLRLLAKAEAARTRIEELTAKRKQTEGKLAAAERNDTGAQQRMDHLEDRFSELVEALQLPEFDTDAEPRSAVHRGNYVPIVNGRQIENHSGGMAVLVNVAYMLALHQTAIDLDLRIPRLLMIDGINKNLGRGEYDSERYRLIWHQLARFHAEYADELQLIVATNDVPPFIEELDVVRLRLSEHDRLVPSPAVAETDNESKSDSNS